MRKQLMFVLVVACGLQAGTAQAQFGQNPLNQNPPIQNPPVPVKPQPPAHPIDQALLALTTGDVFKQTEAAIRLADMKVDDKRRQDQGEAGPMPPPPITMDRAPRTVTIPGRPSPDRSSTGLGPLAGEMYRRIFGELGAREVNPIHAMTRPQANDKQQARIVNQATGIFMTGGNQLRLSSTIGGTALAQAVVQRHEEGAVVAGTSAGASAMSTHMVAFGASGATPKQRMFQMAAGLGILPGFKMPF